MKQYTTNKKFAIMTSSGAYVVKANSKKDALEFIKTYSVYKDTKLKDVYSYN
jgi:hypothetical protein